MDIKLRAVTPAERLYCYPQSVQIEEQTGCVGHLCGGSSIDKTGFDTTWEDHRKYLKTQEFKDEFDKVINTLRFDERFGCVIKNYQTLSHFCNAHPEGCINPNWREFGFRADTAQYSYLMRLNPTQGLYNLYIYCYLRERLNQHMKQAEKGIRFITPDYRECFRISDGDRIRIIRPDGQHSDRVCRYIDEAHMELGPWRWSSLLHICQFAEQMKRALNTVIPLRSTLPDKCYSIIPSSGEIVIVKKGESGYYPTAEFAQNRREAREIVDECNRIGGVTKAQEAAMLAGSMFGWDTLAADPKNYDEQGQPIKPKHSDRGDSR